MYIIGVDYHPSFQQIGYVTVKGTSNDVMFQRSLTLRIGYTRWRRFPVIESGEKRADFSFQSAMQEIQRETTEITTGSITTVSSLPYLTSPPARSNGTANAVLALCSDFRSAS